MSTFHAVCTHCQTGIEVPEYYAGTQIRCTNCGSSFHAQRIVVEPIPVMSKGAPVPLEQIADPNVRLTYHFMTSPILQFGAVFFAICFGLLVWKGCSGNPGSVASDLAGEGVAVYNSGFDGSVQQVKDWMKSHANDAKSIEYVEWSPVAADGDGFMVRCKFRAKNAFGAYVLQNAIFHLDSEGNVTNYTDL